MSYRLELDEGRTVIVAPTKELAEKEATRLGYTSGEISGKERVEIERKRAPKKYPWAPPGWTEEMVEKLKKKMGESKFKEWKKRTTAVYTDKYRELKRTVEKLEKYEGKRDFSPEERREYMKLISKAKKLQEELKDVEFYRGKLVEERKPEFKEDKERQPKERQPFKGRIHEMARTGLTPQQAEVYKRIMKEDYGIDVKFTEKPVIPEPKPSIELGREYFKTGKLETGFGTVLEVKREKMIQPVFTGFPKDIIQHPQLTGETLAEKSVLFSIGKKAEEWYPERLPFGRYMPEPVKDVARGLVSFPGKIAGTALQLAGIHEIRAKGKKVTPLEKTYLSGKAREFEQMKWESLAWGAATSKAVETVKEVKRLGVGRLVTKGKLEREYPKIEQKLHYPIDKKKPSEISFTVDGKKPQLVLERPQRSIIDFAMVTKKKPPKIGKLKPFEISEKPVKARKPTAGELTLIEKPKIRTELKYITKPARITKVTTKPVVIPVVYPKLSGEPLSLHRTSQRPYEILMHRAGVSPYARLHEKVTQKSYEKLTKRLSVRELKRVGVRELIGELTRLGIGERLRVGEKGALREVTQIRPKISTTTRIIRPIRPPVRTSPVIPPFDFTGEEKKKRKKAKVGKRSKRKPAVPLPTYINIQLTEMLTGKEATAFISPKKMRKFWEAFHETGGAIGIPTAEQILGKVRLLRGGKKRGWL